MHDSKTGANQSAMTQSLISLCEGELSVAAVNERFLTSQKAIKVFVNFDGKPRLYSICFDEEQLAVDVELATLQGLRVKVDRNAVVYKETFENQAIMEESAKRIAEISSAWKKQKSAATKSSALKLIFAHFNAASSMLDLGMVNHVNKFASVDWGDVAELRGEVESQDIQSLMTYPVRNKVKNLAAMFGSQKNLRSYYNAMISYKKALKEGKLKSDDAYTADATNSQAQIQWKDERVLFELLLPNLGEKYVTVWGKKDEDTGVQPKFLTVMTPEQLCELIALKLALKMRHQAVDVEEIQEMDFNNRRLATWVQDRVNLDGSKRPDQLALQPKDRANQPDTDNEDTPWYLGYFRVVDMMTPRGVQSYVGRMDLAETWAKEKILTQKNRLYVGSHLKDRTMVRFADYYTYEVESNVHTIPCTKLPSKDYDLWASVKTPTLFNDRRLDPTYDEESRKWVFPKTYAGPSFVSLVCVGCGSTSCKCEDGVRREVIPVKAARCAMHDVGLWKEWKDAGSMGEVPECSHMHIQKATIRSDHWAPKVQVQNSHCTECHGDVSLESCKCGADHEEGRNVYLTEVTCLARKELMQLVMIPSSTGKTSRPVLEFDYEGMRMPLMVPAFKKYVERCLWTRDFAYPPILEETFKPGILTGKFLTRHEELTKDLEMLEYNNDPSAFEVMEELEELESKRKGWDIKKCILHIFVPMNPSLFNLELLPNGYREMAIRVQVSGHRPHLLDLVKENDGYHQYSEYSEDQKTGKWELVSQVWK